MQFLLVKDKVISGRQVWSSFTQKKAVHENIADFFNVDLYVLKINCHHKLPYRLYAVNLKCLSMDLDYCHWQHLSCDKIYFELSTPERG